MTKLSFKQALRECKRVGNAHAESDALKAMYANLIAGEHGGSADRYYAALPDANMVETARSWLRDRAKAWEGLTLL